MYVLKILATVGISTTRRPNGGEAEVYLYIILK